MKKANSGFTVLMAAVMCMAVASSSCKSSKKKAEADARAKAEREARLSREQEEKRRREEADRLKREQEEKENAKKDAYNKVDAYFNRVASSTDDNAASGTISEALALFASPETPVLIIIHQSGDVKDYDRPTTIRKYMEYLKDQKKNPNTVSNLSFDSSGKIKEVELLKK
jgi:hypothetical protein